MKMINLSELPGPARRPVWDAITTHRPQLATLLQEQPLRELVATFDCQTILDTADLGPEVIAVIRHHAEHLV